MAPKREIVVLGQRREKIPYQRWGSQSLNAKGGSTREEWGWKSGEGGGQREKWANRGGMFGLALGVSDSGNVVGA